MRTKVFVLVSVISVNVAASTTLKCIGHGENLYMNDSARYSSDDLIDRVPLKEKKTIYVVFGEDEMDVDGTTYRSNAYNSNNLYNSYDKGESEISGYKSFISFNYDDELTETFDVDRITGEFKSTI